MKRSFLGLIAGLAVLGSAFPAQAEEPDVALESVTSVSQLSDVKPTDWAFQALQSLVERYGCIARFPR